MEVTTMYRYEAGLIQGFDVLQYRDLKLQEYPVIKETPKGYWINTSQDWKINYQGKKWVPKNAVRAFAFPTKEQALKSYQFRNLRRIAFLQRDLRIAQGLKVQVEKLLSK